MRTCQFPKCCGVVNFYDFPYPESWGYENQPNKEKFKNQILKALNKARNGDHQYTLANAIYAESDNASFVKDVLEEVGFQKIKQKRNVRSGHQLHVYMFDLRI